MEKMQLLGLEIWPGNTKGQGARMHAALKGKNWTPPKTIKIQNQSFKIKWGYEIKFLPF